MTGDQPVLHMHGICKSFSGVRVLDDVELTLHEGEVLALLGANGAGKSTLIKILNGDYMADAGEIVLGGKQVDFHTPADALNAGIRAIYQEFNNIPALSVAENILVGALPKTPLGLVDWPATWRMAREVLDELGVAIDPKCPIEDLTVGERQMVEIAKSLWQRHANGAGPGQKTRILIMDEPTSALSAKEVDSLFEVVHRLKREGMAIIYISHRLQEVSRVADRVMVLRDGINVGVMPVEEATPETLVRLMLGRQMAEEEFEHMAGPKTRSGTPLMEVRGLGLKKDFHDLSFTLWPGEILGIFGTLDSGISCVLPAIFGVEPAARGDVLIRGREVRIENARDAKRANLALIPNDRKQQGLVLDLSLAKNITGANIETYTKLGFFDQAKERASVLEWVERLDIRGTGGIRQLVRSLSGGNQQKVVFARWLDTAPHILLCHEPTRGVDVGAKSDIYEALSELKSQDLGIVVVSTELPEILRLSDRILVMRDGVQVAEFERKDATSETLMLAALGGAV